MDAAIEVDGLCKRYGAVTAIADVSFHVAPGEVLGLVGPNGAGKTTIVECLAGLRRPDRGTVRILGLNPERNGRRVRTVLGVQLQTAALQDRITVAEALELFASLYPRRGDVEVIVRKLGLAERLRAQFATLSGGEKQRLFVALALIHDPAIAFLDELTTALDPHGRRAVWTLVDGVRQRSGAVLLTTHMMDEAERLCDRVAILSRGRILAIDAPRRLIERVHAWRVAVTADSALDLDVLRRIPGVACVTRTGDRVAVAADADVTGEVVRALVTAKVPYREVHAERPTLEDVYLQLTGDELAPAA